MVLGIRVACSFVCRWYSAVVSCSTLSNVHATARDLLRSYDPFLVGRLENLSLLRRNVTLKAHFHIYF